MDNNMEYYTQNAQKTYRLGQDFGNNLKGGEVIALVGDLGAGKTTFAQGVASSLGVAQRITSPTFILLRQYENKFGGSLYHVDLYRLEQDVGKELENLGVLDFAQDSKNVVLVEWADKAKEHLPQNSRWIKFVQLDENLRKIEIE